MICDPEESGEKVTDDLLVAQVGIDLACFAGLGEEVLDLCSPLTRGPFVALARPALVSASCQNGMTRPPRHGWWRSVEGSPGSTIGARLVWLDVVEGGRQQVLLGGEVRARARGKASPGGDRAHRGCVPAIPNDRSPRGLDELDSTLLMINNFRHVRGSALSAAAGIRRAGRGPGRGVEARVPRFRASLTRCAECGLGARRPRFGGRDLQDRRR